MKSGLLWYDNSPAPLGDKIAKASKRYEQKFGVAPNHCFVNPRNLDAASAPTLPTLTSPKLTIQLNHLWLGVDESVISGAETDGTDAQDNTPPKPNEKTVLSDMCVHEIHNNCTGEWREWWKRTQTEYDDSPKVFCTCPCHERANEVSQ